MGRLRESASRDAWRARGLTNGEARVREGLSLNLSGDTEEKTRGRERQINMQKKFMFARVSAWREFML